ncbi:hypothetical protein [Actinomadura macrotermitis]|nr:hypothetical protein [Actinomadura macrotermitis]
MPDTATFTGPLRTDASDGRQATSRYGEYLKQHVELFEDDFESVPITGDAVRFAVAAWQVACGPIMSPSYVQWDEPRLQSVHCVRSQWDGSLLARAALAVPPPAPLAYRRLPGRWNGWEHDRFTDRYWEPLGERLVDRPTLLTTATVVLPFTAEELPAPVTAHKVTPLPRSGEAMLTHDAKAAVTALVGLINRQLAPLIQALNEPSRGAW